MRLCFLNNDRFLFFNMYQKKPSWLKVKLPSGKKFNTTYNMLDSLKLNTICTEAKCPNIGECFGHGTATFLILGENCTRNCLYCNVSNNNPLSVDKEEPKNVAQAVLKLGLKYVVITSVTRDDLSDGGAMVFCDVVKEIKKKNPKVDIELLIPDFNGNEDSLKKIINSKPDVLGHNIEVVERLFPTIRPQGNYQLSLNLLSSIKKINYNQKTKSGLMVGLGESKEEIVSTMKDLVRVGVNFFTIGQYLQPRRDLMSVERFYTPEEFKELEKIGLEFGFEHVESGPLVRSSYRADKLNKYFGN